MLKGAEGKGTSACSISEGAGIGRADCDDFIAASFYAAQRIGACAAHQVVDIAEGVGALAGAAAGLGAKGCDGDVNRAATGIAERVVAAAAIDGVVAGVGARDRLVAGSGADAEIGG